MGRVWRYRTVTLPRRQGQLACAARHAEQYAVTWTSLRKRSLRLQPLAANQPSDRPVVTIIPTGPSSQPRARFLNMYTANGSVRPTLDAAAAMTLVVQRKMANPAC